MSHAHYVSTYCQFCAALAPRATGRSPPPPKPGRLLSKRRLQRRQVAVYAVAVALAVGTAVARPDATTAAERLIDPVLATLPYLTVLEIPFVRLRRAFTNGRLVAAALGTNSVVRVLTRALPPDPVVLVGALLVFPLTLTLPAGYGLAPAVVVTQTLVELAGLVLLTRVVPAWLLPDAPAPLPVGRWGD